MSLKVGVLLQIAGMDDSQIINVSRVDTAINPSPGDITAEPALAAQMMVVMVAGALEEMQERLSEYNQMLARLS